MDQHLVSNLQVRHRSGLAFRGDQLDGLSILQKCAYALAGCLGLDEHHGPLLYLGPAHYGRPGQALLAHNSHLVSRLQLGKVAGLLPHPDVGMDCSGVDPEGAGCHVGAVLGLAVH